MRPAAPEALVVWHEVECGGYEADRTLWEELAQSRRGPALDLGCGTGRVALHLARRGHEVTALDLDASLVAALERRAQGLAVTAAVADARDFELGTEFGLIVAPMQLLQLLDGRAQRLACLRRVAAHLRPGGLAAFAIVESIPAAVDTPPPLPDTREVGGWVYSSLPLETLVDDEEILIRRLRQTVSPSGVLEEELHEISLRAIDAPTLEEEARAAGLEPAGRRPIPPTEEHVGSTVVLLERGP